MNERADGNAVRKRLGQFFTEGSLATVLAHLARADKAEAVLDPMAGIGGLLAASAAIGGGTRALAGVEIDPKVAGQAQERLRAASDQARVITGDAFDPETWATLGRDLKWDLIITNPPYIRYQNSSVVVPGIPTPTSQEIRSGLLETLDLLDLSDEDRRVLKVLTRGYSGLADIAVPSWILCVALLRVGGRLAIVVPEAWLTRDYALPVQYLVSRFLTVESVVRDLDSVWFPDALVRTNLLVASRVSHSSYENGQQGPQEVHVSLWSGSQTESSVVGGLFPQSSTPEYDFATAVAACREGRSVTEHPGARFEIAKQGSRLSAVRGKIRRQRWLAECEGIADRSGQVEVVHVPDRIGRAVTPELSRLITLEDAGWRAGQGLRTGANVFFYVRIVESHESRALVEPDRRISDQCFEVPIRLLRRSIRRQQDLGGISADFDQAANAVLDLTHVALAEDLAALAAEGCPTELLETLDEMPESVARFVRTAATTNLGEPDNPRFVSDLSAVAPNIRAFDPDRPERVPRFWYQLPRFTDRHAPDLFIPRVNHRHPLPYLNPRRQLLVDANFITLWREPTALSVAAMVALLSSTWTAAWLEEISTVLGGGALKVEATTLRDLAFPHLSPQEIETLDRLGVLLAESEREVAVVVEIDAVLSRSIDRDASALAVIAEAALADRSGNLRAGGGAFR